MTSFDGHNYFPNDSTILNQNNSSSFEQPRLDETIFHEPSNAVIQGLSCLNIMKNINKIT